MSVEGVIALLPRKLIMPLLAKAKNRLSYDPDAGVFTHQKTGERAGSNVHKYRTVRVGHTQIAEHRLAWAWVYGEEPPAYLDHIDQNPHNNAINNLRDGGNSVNWVNAAPKRGARMTGVHSHLGKYWQAKDKDRRSLYFGRDLFEACAARKSWENKFWGSLT